MTPNDTNRVIMFVMTENANDFGVTFTVLTIQSESKKNKRNKRKEK
jgi:hypothetical protein